LYARFRFNYRNGVEGAKLSLGFVHEVVDQAASYVEEHLKKELTRRSEGRARLLNLILVNLFSAKNDPNLKGKNAPTGSADTKTRSEELKDLNSFVDKIGAKRNKMADIGYVDRIVIPQIRAEKASRALTLMDELYKHIRHFSSAAEEKIALTRSLIYKRAMGTAISERNRKEILKWKPRRIDLGNSASKEVRMLMAISDGQLLHNGFQDLVEDPHLVADTIMELEQRRLTALPSGFSQSLRHGVKFHRANTAILVGLAPDARAYMLLGERGSNRSLFEIYKEAVEDAIDNENWYGAVWMSSQIAKLCIDLGDAFYSTAGSYIELGEAVQADNIEACGDEARLSINMVRIVIDSLTGVTTGLFARYEACLAALFKMELVVERRWYMAAYKGPIA
jgi:hypothetical protein